MPLQGYEALRTNAASVDLSDRGKLKVTGEDRARLLHAMTTQHVQEMQPGDCRYAFFLNVQGRILADVWILCQEESLLLITEPETRQRVFEHLDQYIIADDVQVEDVTDQWRLATVEGPAAGAQELPITATGLPGGALLWRTGDPEPAALANVPKASAEAARAVRIENGKPRYGEEITDRFLVQETGQMAAAVHGNKGCYLGQEIVERVRARGQVHRHLRSVRIEGTRVPVSGEKILTPEGKELGEIVSAVESPALGGVVAGMAYVRTEAATAGSAIALQTAEGNRVTVV